MPRSRRRASRLVVALLAGSLVGHAVGVLLVHEFVWTVYLMDPLPHEEPVKEPEEVEVAWVTLPASENPEIQLPDKDLADIIEEEEKKLKEEEEKKLLVAKKPEPPKVKKPEPPKVRPPEPKVAKVDPPKPPPDAKKPPPPTPKVKPPEPKKIVKVEPPKPKAKPPEPPKQIAKVEPKPKPKPPAPKERKKMIEVDDDKNVVEKPNHQAKYYSDKDRQVEVEMVDRNRNLEKGSKGKGEASAEKNKNTDEQVGGETEKNAQLEDSKASSLDAKRKKVASVHNGKHEHAEGIQTGDRGQQGDSGGGGTGGDGGNGGDGGENGKPGALSMRNIEGRGAPGKNPVRTGASSDDSPEVAMSTEPQGRPGKGGRDGKPGKAGKPGKRGPKLQLDNQDYKRIVGDDKAEEEVAIARRAKSHKKGRWEKKVARIQSSLETFTGDVKPGNQTALGTRKHPFGVYIARMHNRIHELWGYGFIADLDSKSYGNAMNERSLAVTMEIVIAPSGEVEKVTIVRPSGQLTFDVAAVDTVMTSGPYEETPEDIRSANGFVYVHWTFHRDERLCSPYFADPFILDNPNAGHEKHAHGHGEGEGGEGEGKEERKRPKKLTRGDEDDGVKVPHVTREQVPEGDPAAAARTEANTPTPDDPEAEKVALAWANAFEKDDMAQLVALSETPFKSRDVVVAEDAAGLASVWRAIMNETEKRDVKQWKLLSAAGYRALFGVAAPGASDGTAMLFLVAKVDGGYFTMQVAQKSDGTYRIVGFNR